MNRFSNYYSLDFRMHYNLYVNVTTILFFIFNILTLSGLTPHTPKKKKKNLDPISKETVRFGWKNETTSVVEGILSCGIAWTNNSRSEKWLWLQLLPPVSHWSPNTLPSTWPTASLRLDSLIARRYDQPRTGSNAQPVGRPVSSPV